MVKLTLYVLVFTVFAVNFVAGLIISLTGESTGGLTIVSGLLAAFFGLLIYGNIRNRKAQKERTQASQLAAQEVRKLERLPIVETSKVVLRSGEQAHFSAPAVLLKNQTLGYSGNSAGVSVRVAKGVTLRTGGMKGHAIKGLAPIAKGELALLNSRMVFAGDYKSFETPYSKITHVEQMRDGVVVHVGNTSHVVQLADAHQALVLHAVTDRLLTA